MSEEEILEEHPDLEREDIREALRHAAPAVFDEGRARVRQLPMRPD